MRTLNADIIKAKLRIIGRFLTNPHFLICFGVAWMITNGWSYLALALGMACHWQWLAGAAGAYLAVLWFPGTPEKLVTTLLALWLLKRFYPQDVQAMQLINMLKEKDR